MATPVCPNVRKGFETVGNTMVNLLPVIFLKLVSIFERDYK
jgi:hypothetical protein